MGYDLRRIDPVRDTCVRGLRRLRYPFRLARGQVEPRGDDGGLLYRHWCLRHIVGFCKHSHPNGYLPDAGGRFCIHLPPCWTGYVVVQGLEKTGIPLAINGIWGNMGVASAALLTGYLVDTAGWQAGFIIPGAISIVFGLAFWWFVASGRCKVEEAPKAAAKANEISKAMLIRLFGIILFTTAIGGLVFQYDLRAAQDLRRTSGRNGWKCHYGWLVRVYRFHHRRVRAIGAGYLVDRHSIRAVFAVVALLQAVFFYFMIHLEGVAALLVAIAFMLAVFGQIPINDVLVGRIAKSGAAEPLRFATL